MQVKNKEIDAVVLDLDGVITRTAHLHARAWKQMFDEFLADRSQAEGTTYAPFDARSDYRQFVDGKPRYEGVQSFLASRHIKLPYGSPEDGADEPTVCGLGNRKNEVFHELLNRDGAEVFDDALDQLQNWRQQGLKLAVVSSSRNCQQVLASAGLADFFDAKIDGNDLERLSLAGKPQPDSFLRAASEIGAEPGRSMMLEDAIAGVQAGRAGRFALVVGVARDDDADDLYNAGADLVVSDLREIHAASLCPPGHACLQTPAAALAHLDWLGNRVRERKLGLFLDYDGTLTPIVRRPEDAILSDEMRSLLKQLAQVCTLAIISGRDRKDVEQMVGVENLIYAGSHGFDIRGPDIHQENEAAQTALPDLDAAEAALNEQLSSIAGARVERKKFAIAVHYREVEKEADVAQVESVVDAVLRETQSLRKKGGKKIFELQPDVPWDKGEAVLWVARSLGLLGAGVTLVYIGDDVTDEDAFRALRYRGAGIGILVGPPTSATSAGYYLRDCDEVQSFLQALLNILSQSQVSS